MNLIDRTYARPASHFVPMNAAAFQATLACSHPEPGAKFVHTPTQTRWEVSSIFEVGMQGTYLAATLIGEGHPMEAVIENVSCIDSHVLDKLEDFKSNFVRVWA